MTATRFSTLTMQDGSVVETGVRFIEQADMLRCPFAIMMPEHYREDGICKCNDADEREMMKREWEYTDEDFREVGLIT